MTRYFFTGDTHFLHSNILKYCNRPYKNITEHDYRLKQLWNSRVTAEDVVFHLGDFCFKVGETKAKDIMKELNGEIILIRGNHDSQNSVKTNIEAVTLYFGGKWLLLVHRPEDALWYSHTPPYDLVLCGHVHQHWRFKRFRKQEPDYCNVGVDVWSGYPVTIEEILKEFEKWKRETYPK